METSKLTADVWLHSAAGKRAVRNAEKETKRLAVTFRAERRVTTAMLNTPIVRNF